MTLLIFCDDIYANPKIYIIRHAAVQIEKPGWGSSEKAFQYKLEYNTTSVEDFNPVNVLNKIDDYETIDTVYCSPQLRAIQTANILFEDQVILNINDNLMELQYPVVQWSVIKLPVRVWLTSSLIFWMAGNNRDSIPSYKERKQSLEDYSEEIIDYAERNGKSIIVAHGVVNSELIKILKLKGWKFEDKEGYKNLAVNCLVRK